MSDLPLRDMISLGAWRMGLGCSGEILPSPSTPPTSLAAPFQTISIIPVCTTQNPLGRKKRQRAEKSPRGNQPPGKSDDDEPEQVGTPGKKRRRRVRPGGNHPHAFFNEGHPHRTKIRFDIRFPLMSFDFFRFLRFPSISVDFRLFPSISCDFLRFHVNSSISFDFFRFPLISFGFIRFRLICFDFI